MRISDRFRVLFLIVAIAPTFSALFAQRPPASLSLDAITENLVLPEALQQQRIKERRVNFELNDEQAAALKKKGASDAVIGLIKEFRLTGVIQVTCKPIDCTVLVNEQQKGQTADGVLRLELSPGPIAVEVQAPNYRSAVAVFLIEVNKVKVKDFVLEPVAPPLGAVAMTCDAGAVECEVGVDDRSFQSTTRKSIQFADLAPGPHRFLIRAIGFLDSSRDVTIKGGATEMVNVKLAPIPVVDPAPFLDDILKALGGEANLGRAQKLGARGTMTVTTDLDRRTTRALFVESVKLPFIRWDLLIDGQEWSSGTTATDAWSDGNGKLKNTPLAFELPKAMQVFKATRITDLVWFKNSIFAMHVVENAGRRALVLESKEDRFTVTFDKNPMQATMVRETIGGTLRTELTYEKFANVNGLMLPHRMTIKFPGFTSVLEYENYFLGQELVRKETFAERRAGFQKSVELSKQAEEARRQASGQK